MTEEELKKAFKYVDEDFNKNENIFRNIEEDNFGEGINLPNITTK